MVAVEGERCKVSLLWILDVLFSYLFPCRSTVVVRGMGRCAEVLFHMQSGGGLWRT
jgi:hypothetical protein